MWVLHGKGRGITGSTSLRTVDKGPTNRLKLGLSIHSGESKRIPTWVKVFIGPCTLLVVEPQSFMNYLRSIKQVPPQPIVSSRGSVTYVVAKVLAGVLKPIISQLPHHIQSTRTLVNRVREVTLLPEECLNSYDVSALFTSVPIDPALNIIKNLLEQDDTLHDRSVLSVQNIIELLGFCLHNTYFSFQNKFYEQSWGSSHRVTSQP